MNGGMVLFTAIGKQLNMFVNRSVCPLSSKSLAAREVPTKHVWDVQYFKSCFTFDDGALVNNLYYSRRC